MGLCGFSPKVSAVIAAVLTLLQGLLWTVLGILSLLIYSCSIYASEEFTPQFYRLYLVYLYIASVSEIKGVKGVLLRAPWLVLTSFFVILDVITSIIYAIDISYTSNLEKLLAFVGLTADSGTVNSSSTSSTFGYLTMAPSILAVVIFSRVVVGWVLNLILLIHVAPLLKKLTC